MGSESERKFGFKNAKRVRILFLLIMALFLAVGLLMKSSFASKLEAFAAQGVKKTAPLDLRSFEYCAASVPNVKAPAEFTTKPIWVAMVPFVLSDAFHKNLINSMTGTTSGGKSFYASVKGGLKRCIGNGQSVTCLNVHPYVKMTGGQPDSISNNYYSKYILALRNPMTSLPATYNAKSAKYGGLIGQTEEKDWKNARDLHFDGMLKNWRDTITVWSETKYDLAMYLVYEDFYDAKKGIILMKRLRSVLLEAGFTVASEEELNCIWINTVGIVNLQRFHKFQYDYEDYIPSFTVQQKGKMLKEIQQLRKQLSTDVELSEILDQYATEIDTTMKIDAGGIQSD